MSGVFSRCTVCAPVLVPGSPEEPARRPAKRGVVAEFSGFDHLDVRVRSLAAVEAFYDRLLPALGLGRKAPAHVSSDDEWLPLDDAHPYNAVEYYEAARPGRRPAFVGIIEHAATAGNRSRIAFAVATKDDVRAWAARLPELGAVAVELDADFENYPAVFFEDPVGTRLEICARNVAT